MRSLDGIQIFRPKQQKLRRFRLKDRASREALKIKRIQVGLLIVLIAIVGFLGMYWIGNGFSVNVVGESNSFYLNIDSPNEMQKFYAGEQIAFHGGVIGDTLAKVTVWDTDYNVAIPCTITPTKWGVYLYATDFSSGIHTMAVQAQGITGEWSPVSTVTIEIRGTIAGATAPGYMSDSFGPLAPIFRPIEDIVRGLSIRAAEGTAANDQNGNNIDDRFESNPISPRYNPFNLPLSFLLIFIVLGGIIIVLARYGYSYMQRRQIQRSQMAQRIVMNPQSRQWYLQLKALTNKQLRAEVAKEKAALRVERVRMESKVAKLEAERERLLQEKEEATKQKPVKIMIIPKVSARPVPKQTGMRQDVRNLTKTAVGMAAIGASTARGFIPKKQQKKWRVMTPAELANLRSKNPSANIISERTKQVNGMVNRYEKQNSARRRKKAKRRS
jgi:hypothetical protein